MKLVLLGLCLLPLAALRSSPRVPTPVDDPPPVECPFCGGNVQLHAQVVTGLTAAQAKISLQALSAGWL